MDMTVGTGGLVTSPLFDDALPICCVKQDYAVGDLIMVRLWPPEVQKTVGVQGEDVTPLKEVRP